MKQFSLNLILSLILFLSGSVVLAQEITVDTISGKELILKFHKRKQATRRQALLVSLRKAGASEQLQRNFVKEFSQKHGLEYRVRKLHKLKSRAQAEFALLELDEEMSPEQIQNMVKVLNKEKFANSDYEIEAVFPNQLYEISEEPNDPLYNQQWSIPMIQPEKFWKFTKGEGAVVAVIDTGVDYNHVDLAENIWSNLREIPGNGKDDDRNGYIDDVRGWDFVSGVIYNCAYNEDCSKEDNDPMDKHGHGTHVAGIIAARQNNAVGISGIAPEAKIMALRAGYSSGSSAYLKTSDILEAITYAINNGADVINMSFAGSELSVLQEILDFAEQMGVVSVAAAGNNGSNRMIYPAAIESVLAVGAIADNSMKLHFSNFGTWVDIVAPGSWVMSTIPGDSYDIKSGTSMAAPHVAAIAALIKAKNKIRKPSARDVKDKILAARTESLFYKERGSTETIGKLSAVIGFPLEVDEVQTPSLTLVNEEAMFAAKASDSEEDVIEYDWESNQDGYLDNQQSFSTNSLSLGAHLISVRARNTSGAWSDPVYKVVNVVETRPLNPNSQNSINFRMRQRRGRIYARMTKRNRRNVAQYQWISSKDGVVSTSRKISLKDLNPGYQQLSLMVQNKDGVWTGPVQKILRR